MAGGAFILSYAYLQNDEVIVAGQIINLCIYARNQFFITYPKQNKTVVNRFMENGLFIAVIFVLVLLVIIRIDTTNAEESLSYWVGWTGLIIFNTRFPLQWFHLEKTGKSAFPKLFWMVSLVGSCLLFYYALSRVDFIIMIGQIFGIVCYSRNLYFMRRRSSSYVISN